MRSSAITPAPLVPTLADVFNKRVRHTVTDLRGGDQLHLTAPVAGFPKGSVHGIYGYCTYTDEQGQVYAVTAYVRGGSQAVAYTDRAARRYATANQHEQWFGSVLMYLTEIDLTDYADCLRLERLSDRVLPLLTDLTPDYCQAA